MCGTWLVVEVDALGKKLSVRSTWKRTRYAEVAQTEFDREDYMTARTFTEYARTRPLGASAR
jgi:hypothetical protein